MKLLTIVIPTHNRSKFLKINLDILIPQVLLYKNEVDLLISDNHSDDETKTVVMDYMNKYPNCLVYNCNDEDKGYLYNFNIGVHLSNSNYVYLLGDDDIVPDGFVATIVELLRTYRNIGLLHINYLQLSKRLKSLKIYYKGKTYGEVNKIFEFKDFISEFYDGPTFMSSLVFKREIWLKGENRFKENCYGYDWLMKIFAGCDGCKCLYHNMPIMIQVDSGVNPYNKLWALYSIIGKSRIFENLDKDYKGLYDGWKKYRKKKHCETYDVLSVSYDLKTYRLRSKELNNYVFLTRHKVLLGLTLHLIPSFFTKHVFIQLLKLIILLESVK